MARPRGFDEDEVLHQAMLVFWRHGYEATTYKALEEATGVGARSLVNTFGDKDALFVRSLAAYRATAVELIGQLFEPPGVDAVQALFTVLGEKTDTPDDMSNAGCLMVNTVFELGRVSAPVRAEVDAYRELWRGTFEAALLASGIDQVRLRAEFLLGALWGALSQVRLAGTTEAAAPMAAAVRETVASWLAGRGRAPDVAPDNALGRVRAWVLGPGRRRADPGAFLEGLCGQLRAAGLAVDRATIGAPLLHPIAQSSFAIWDAGKPLEKSWVRWDAEGLEKLRNSPIFALYHDADVVDWRVQDEPERYAVGAELAALGFTHYLGLALPFADGSNKAMTVQTKAVGGFDGDARDLVTALVPAVATVLEGHVQRRLGHTLMETYVGGRAGARVLNGQIARGDGDTLRAVIWMSDLRGFTNLAAALSPEDLLGRLNRYFGAVTRAVDEAGGEVLKFIGDAVLAVFPVGGEGRVAVANAEAAVDAVLAAARADDWPADVAFGVGLHVGEVFYGNVGGETRLDFTVIGPAVNMVSRVEGLCGTLGEAVLVTAAFARLSDRGYRGRGEHMLKGIAGPVAVLAPN